MSKIHIKNAFIINEGILFKGNILINNDIIAEITENNSDEYFENAEVIDAEGLYLFPGIIDNHVHFREPGLTHKADIETESSAAVAGGITSFMEMPNTNPAAISVEILEDKFKIAAQKSKANFSFYMGVNSNNTDEILNSNINSYSGLKLFLGSSTGNMKVDNLSHIETLFQSAKQIIALHCEDDQIVNDNLNKYKEIFGDDIPFSFHHKIRSAEACFSSSKFAVELAKKYNTKIHIMHLSTADELSLLESKSLKDKNITAEVCVHHLWFTADDYENLGAKIKWNPAIKETHHRDALRSALNQGLIDVIGTDHAPHLLSEKDNVYAKSPSGAPIIQFSLQIMLELVKQNIISIEKISELMAHNPATLFNIEKRGFIRKGYFADLVLVDRNKEFTVNKDIILSKCKWSPLEGQTFSSTIKTTLVNGAIAFDNSKVADITAGKRLIFNR